MRDVDFLISVDPATGSSSLPAWSAWVTSDTATEYLGSWQLRVKGRDHWSRMQAIAMGLPGQIINIFGQEVTDNAPHLVIEGLPPTLSGLLGNGKGFANAASIHLHHAVAVIASCLPFASVTELPVQRWKSFLKHMECDSRYVKSDLNDSAIIGLAYLCAEGYVRPTQSVNFQQQILLMGLDIASLEAVWAPWHKHINKAGAKNTKRKAKEKT